MRPNSPLLRKWALALLAASPVCFLIALYFANKQSEVTGSVKIGMHGEAGSRYYVPQGGSLHQASSRVPVSEQQYQAWSAQRRSSEQWGYASGIFVFSAVLLLIHYKRSAANSRPPSAGQLVAGYALIGLCVILVTMLALGILVDFRQYGN